MREITEANKWNYFRSGARAGYVTTSSSSFPLPLLMLKRHDSPPQRLWIVLFCLSSCLVRSKIYQVAYITEMNIDRTKVITVLVLCNTQLYFLLLEKWHQQLDVSTSCKVCNMMSIYSLEKSFKSPRTWLSTCIFQNILEYSITLYFAHIHVLSVHIHTQRLDKDLIIIFSLWKFTIADFSQIT